MTPEEQQALEKVGLDPKTLFGWNRTFRYEEYILRKGDELYILGNCEPNPKPEYEMVMTGTSEKPLFVSDKSEADLIKKYEGKAWLFGFLIFLFLSLAVAVLIWDLKG